MVYLACVWCVVFDIICRKLKKVTSNLFILRLSYFCTLFLQKKNRSFWPLITVFESLITHKQFIFEESYNYYNMINVKRVVLSLLFRPYYRTIWRLRFFIRMTNERFCNRTTLLPEVTHFGLNLTFLRPLIDLFVIEGRHENENENEW